MGDLKICMLLYADDIAIISENEQKLQKLLNHVHEWCKKWQLNLNIDKTQIVHFRKSQKQRTKFEFKIGLDKVMVVSKYKYLGTFLDEFLIFNENAQILADSAGRGLGSVFSKFKLFKDCGYRTYEKMKTLLWYQFLVMGQEYGGLIKMVQQKKFIIGHYDIS